MNDSDWISAAEIEPGMTVEFVKPDGGLGKIHRIVHIGDGFVITSEGERLTPPERVFVWEDA